MSTRLCWQHIRCDRASRGSSQLRLVTLAVSSGKCNVTVWRPSVRPSVCPVFFLTSIERAAHAQRNSPGVSMRLGQRTFQPDNTKDRHSCLMVKDRRKEFAYQAVRLECRAVQRSGWTARSTILPAGSLGRGTSVGGTWERSLPSGRTTAATSPSHRADLRHGIFDSSVIVND